MPARRACTLIIIAALAGCGPELLDADEQDLGVAPLEVRLCRITPGGLVPPAVPLLQDGSSVVFVNDTPDRVVAVVVSGALCHLRCSFTDGFRADGQATFTARPLDPGAAASLCVHDAGRFPFVVEGPGGAPHAGVLEIRPAAAAPHGGAR